MQKKVFFLFKKFFLSVLLRYLSIVFCLPLFLLSSHCKALGFCGGFFFKGGESFSLWLFLRVFSIFAAFCKCTTVCVYVVLFLFIFLRFVVIIKSVIGR